MINGKTVSLCMVVYNSSNICERAINSVKSIIDEIVIVDQGSTEIESGRLKSLADFYIKTTNKGNGDYDRQFCYSFATKDYILALDADEYFNEEQLNKLIEIFKYDFHVTWFLFENIINNNDKEINIKDILKDDPHPRLWKRLIEVDGNKVPPIIWPHQAHIFPNIPTPYQVFSEIYITHYRLLENVIKTHLHRKNGISNEAQIMERNFVRAVIDKFPYDDKKILNEKFPELKNYLKD